MTGPRSGQGVPPSQVRMDVPPGQGWGTPRIAYAWTGYAAGGTPLAVSRRKTFLFFSIFEGHKNDRVDPSLACLCLITLQEVQKKLTFVAVSLGDFF